MSEVTKRQRDSSATPEPEAKRPNVETKSQSTPKDKSSRTSTEVKKKMADDDTKPMVDEKDAVDLGNAAASETGSSSGVKNEAGNGSNGAGQDVSVDGAGGSAGSVGDSSETQATQISMRTLIITGDASIIIGKQGKHINEIREKSNARLNIVSISWTYMRHTDEDPIDLCLNAFFFPTERNHSWKPRAHSERVWSS